MKVLLTGASGQLGQAFVNQLKHHSGTVLVACTRSDLDITDADNVRQVLAREQPDIVINTAAYTQVDQAESDRQAAYSVNQGGPANLAETCQSLSIPLLHFSTDCVFDGHKQGGWIEGDPTKPLSVYGTSKLAGEEAVQRLCHKHLIFRVSWVFSEYAHNFVKTMLKLGASHEQLRVVSDQIGKPTCATEIVRVVLDILPKLDNQWGIYHLAQPEAVSWHQFAEAIFSQVKTAGHHSLKQRLCVKEVVAIPTADYPTPAQRPANSVLDSSKLQQTFDLRLNHWRESLEQTLFALGHGTSNTDQERNHESL